MDSYQQELSQYSSNSLASLNMPIDLVLVRHGESEGNLAQDRARAGDATCWKNGFGERHTSRYRLTERGRMQARQAGSWLLKHFPEGFDYNFCSEYVRAMETAACLEIPNAVWTLNLYLREKDAGVFSGKPRSQSTAAENAEYAAERKRRDREQFYYAAPGGESIAQTCFRVDMFLQSLVQSCAGLRVVAVVHRNVMMAFRVVLERIPQLRFEEVFLKDPSDDMDNCHILHYSRRNPMTREIHSRINFVRSLLPWKRLDKGWIEICRPRFTAAELLKMVSGVQQMVNNTQEEIREMEEEEDAHREGKVQRSQSPLPGVPVPFAYAPSSPISITGTPSAELYPVSPCISPGLTGTPTVPGHAAAVTVSSPLANSSTSPRHPGLSVKKQ